MKGRYVGVTVFGGKGFDCGDGWSEGGGNGEIDVIDVMVIANG